jgi:DNA transposition AAA+ family ATPase
MTASTQARSFNYQAIEDAWTKGKIAVLDSMPGSGKTTTVTNYLRETELNHVIFVSPFKSEVEQELPKRKLEGLSYSYPQSGRGGKVTHLKELMTMGDTSSGNWHHKRGVKVSFYSFV